MGKRSRRNTAVANDQRISLTLFKFAALGHPVELLLRAMAERPGAAMAALPVAAPAPVPAPMPVPAVGPVPDNEAVRPEVEVDHHHHHQQQQQQNPAAGQEWREQGQGEAEEANWNPMEWDRPAEELTWERLLGLDGSLLFLEHVFWVMSLNTLFIVVRDKLMKREPPPLLAF
jgi:hypothetical protein